MTKNFDTQSVGKKREKQWYGGTAEPKSINKNLVCRNTAVRDDGSV